MRLFLLLLLVLRLVGVAPAMADCMEQTVFEITFIPKSCRQLDPAVEPELKNYSGQVFGDRDTFMAQYYHGALVVGDNNQMYVYPSPHTNACDQFPIGKQVSKGITQSCCDSGRWGKCILGGQFLHDIGSKPVNSFQ